MKIGPEQVGCAFSHPAVGESRVLDVTEEHVIEGRSIWDRRRWTRERFEAEWLPVAHPQAVDHRTLLLRLLRWIDSWPAPRDRPYWFDDGARPRDPRDAFSDADWAELKRLNEEANPEESDVHDMNELRK